MLVAVAVLAAGAIGCAPGSDPDPDDSSSALDLANATVNEVLLAGFPSRHRDQLNFLGERDAEIADWSLHYVVTPDGFDGVVAFGREPNGTVRYLTALDSNTRVTMVLDGVAVARNDEAASAKGARGDATTEFVAKTFDEVTIQWLRSELYRMIASLEEDLAATNGGGIGPRALSSRQVCALRLAIYAASMVLPFTKVPLIGRGASLTAQFVGSFVVDAAGSAAIGQLTDAARSSAAAASSGIALASVLRPMSTPVRSLGASGAGWAASFVVGAMLGTEGDLQLLPGERVERVGDDVIIVHADGTRTRVAAGGAYRLLPVACRQAFGSRIP